LLRGVFIYRGLKVAFVAPKRNAAFAVRLGAAVQASAAPDLASSGRK